MQRRFTILVADDDADGRRLMRVALHRAGYDVQLAVDGEDALRQFRATRCDMVMLDVEMPDLSGYEVCARLRAEGGGLLPIVMVTGMDDVASVETAYEHGATDFISKPVHWAVLGHRVRYLLRSYVAMLDLRAAEARHAAILNAIPDMLFELDEDGRCIDFRGPRGRFGEHSAGTLIGQTVREVLPRNAAVACMAALREAQELGVSTSEQFQLNIDGKEVWFELSVSLKATEPGQPRRFIVLSRNITARKRAEAHVSRLAYFDSLTGLPNRRSFLERVDRSIQRAAKCGEKLAILFMDLDGFKSVNDTMGHAAGDLILQWAAERLRDGMRPTDALSRPMELGDEVDDDRGELARLGGDEFCALLLDIQRPEDALAVARRLGSLMRRPFALEGRDVTLTTSVGIALYPEDGRDSASLLKHADTAMYHAKNQGRDNVQAYSASLTQEIRQRMELDASLRVALEREEFHLVYQPQVDARSGQVREVEALLRWTHPVRGLISPQDFVPLAEDNGLIRRIGQWVLRTACTDAARWQRQGLALKVAVNVSPRQFNGGDLPDMVERVLAQTGLAPQRLEIEVTEGAVMENSVATLAALQALRRLDVGMALDDFGTGYSSLAYLTRMPIGKIKVDRCFITGLLEGGESEAIVRAVLAMAHSLGMRVTAEGVETLAQAQALRAMACDNLQGFFFSRPVAAEAIPALLGCRWDLGSGEMLAAGTPRGPGGAHCQSGTAGAELTWNSRW